jgi:hypothetical protein
VRTITKLNKIGKARARQVLTARRLMAMYVWAGREERLQLSSPPHATIVTSIVDYMDIFLQHKQY